VLPFSMRSKNEENVISISFPLPKGEDESSAECCRFSTETWTCPAFRRRCGKEANDFRSLEKLAMTPSRFLPWRMTGRRWRM